MLSIKNEVKISKLTMNDTNYVVSLTLNNLVWGVKNILILVKISISRRSQNKFRKKVLWNKTFLAPIEMKIINYKRNKIGGNENRKKE